jgi:hypothetical protein
MQEFKHKLRICYTYFFSPAKIFMSTRLTVTLYIHWLFYTNIASWLLILALRYLIILRPNSNFCKIIIILVFNKPRIEFQICGQPCFYNDNDGERLNFRIQWACWRTGHLFSCSSWSVGHLVSHQLAINPVTT